MASQSSDEVTLVSPEVDQRIQGLFIRYGYGCRSIARDLQRDGIHISEGTVESILLGHGLKPRYQDVDERAAALRKAIDFLIDEDRELLASRGFGRAYDYAQFALEASDHLGFVPPFFGDHQPERRLISNWRQHEDFTVPGPNFAWSLEGCELLENLGFSICACVDVYSRMILWVYVGRPDMRAASILKQYLRTVSAAGVRPLFIRSDHGVETLYWASAHATLADLDGVEVDLVDRDARRVHRQGTHVASSHMRGPSLNVQDQSFPLWWNGHRAQPQNTRLPAGIPEDLYKTDQARNWAVPLGPAARTELDRMLEDVDSVDIDELLPQPTLRWCESQLQDLGFDSQSVPDHERPHFHMYIQLRDRIQAHIDRGNEAPSLQTPQVPGGRLERFLGVLQQSLLAPEGLSGDPVPSELVGHIDQVMAEVATLRR